MTRYFNKTVMLFALVAAMIASLSSCSDDDATAYMSFNSQTIFIEKLGETVTVGFTTFNIYSVEVTEYPKGWTAEPDLENHRMVVTAPKDENDGAVRFGTITMTGVSHEGSKVTAELFVSIAQYKDLADQQSNTYVVNQINTNYTFNPAYKGEGTEPVGDIASVDVVWKTSKNLLRFLEYKDGKISFYVGASDDNKTLLQGNALIAAYDPNGTIIWTWQIWVADYDPDVEAQTYANGKIFMSRNLGAAASSNDTKDNILASYGTYYQWGRREPFVGPSTYNAAEGSGATIYNGSNTVVRFGYMETTAEIGTETYARANPLTYILGTDESDNDWLYSAHSSALWGDTKTMNDPCPKGWRVPSKNDFAGLSIKDDITVSDASSVFADKYGWTLTDGTVDAFYIAAGRRLYKTGKIQNIYNPLPKSRVAEAQPWEGLYWTTGTDTNNKSSAFYFYFDYQNPSSSKVEYPSPAYQRANGMQIRCVKIK